MLKIENVEIAGFGPALRGMRNPKNSWDRSDTTMCEGLPFGECMSESTCETAHSGQCYNGLIMGPADMKLAETLADGGPVHAKYRRMIIVWLDVTAPLYWWKEFDTYKVGTVANSCSTMHKIHAKEFVEDDFSHDQMTKRSQAMMSNIIDMLNFYREAYLDEVEDAKEHGDYSLAKHFWWQMIQLLPSSYNQKRTVMLSYEVLANIYKWRRNHKLDEWHTFCDWIESLPYSNLITGVRG